MRKRILAMVLVLVICFPLIPTLAVAAEWTVHEVIPPKYQYASEFTEGLAAVANREYKWGFIDQSGAEVIPCKYDWAHSFSEGFACVAIQQKDYYDKWAVIDKSGKEITPFKYDWISSFQDGIAVVRVIDENHENPKYGFIDQTGAEIIPCIYDYADNFSEGLASISRNGKYGFINKAGEEIIPCQYNMAFSFSEGYAAVCIGKPYSDGKWGFIDRTGEEVIPCQYIGVSSFFDGLAWAVLPNKTRGFINQSGDYAFPYSYNYIEFMGSPLISTFSEGFAEVSVGQRPNIKYGFIDKTGTEIIPCKYVSTKDFYNGFAAVALDSGEEGWIWGFIDLTGKEVVPCKYDGVLRFSEGYAAVCIGNPYIEGEGKWGFVDTTGAEVIPCKYDSVRLGFSEGLAAVKEGKNWGYISIIPKPHTATPTNDALTVDGVTQIPTAYKIGGANYFQLRDVAMLLNGTPAQFSVDYDEVLKAVKITTGKPYSPLGWELAGTASGSAEAIEGNNDIYINGEKVDFTAYKIGGTNFFQIRALGKALGFNVGWSKAAGMYIESDKPYSDAD